jgi:site-specific DNA recombinase
MSIEKKNAVIYCRVSTKEQVDEGNSLITQERACTEYALKHGYEISKAFIEQGESAKTTDRTELQNLLSFCANKKNNVNVVIAYKIDRISRNTDDYSQIRILLKRYGVEIKSTTEHFEDTPAGRFMENIIANVAQFDNDVRTERCIGGMREAMREGRYVWYAPVGYSNAKVNGKSNIIKNEKSPFIKKLFEEVAKGVEAPEIIRRKLNDSKSSVQVSRSQFFRLLRNRTYTGWIQKFGEQHKGTFEPIISEDIFQHVQWLLNNKMKKIKGYTVRHPDFPLRRFVSHQGLKLTGSWSQGKRKKYAYYRYMTKGTQFAKSTLEKKFAAFMNRYALDNSSYTLLKRKIVEQLGKQSKDEIKAVEATKKRITEIQAMQSNLYQKNYKGVITDTFLAKELAKLESEEHKLSHSLLDFPEVNYDSTEAIKHASEILKNPGKIWLEASFDLKQKLQVFEFPSGVLFDGKNFRTPGICRFFKDKNFFLTSQSHEVDFPNETSNTGEITNNEEKQRDFVNSISDDLVKLHELVDLYKYPHRQKPAEDPLSILSSLPL